MNITEKIKNSKTFCILPFTHIATKTDGTIKLCCRSRPMGNINNNSIEEIWNGEDYKRIRNQVLSGERPIECEMCWRHEDQNVTSMRKRVNKQRTGQYLHKVEKILDDYSMPFEIPVIEAKFSNFCNLKCRMCHPLDSTSWSKDWGAIEHLQESSNRGTFEKVKLYDLKRSPHINGWENNEKFWEEFTRLIPHLDKIEFAGGEPLIDPIHYRVLNLLKPYGNKITVKYSTNLTKLDYKKQSVLELWNHFKSIQVYISIDGIHDMYNYIRQGAKYEIVKRNIEIVKNHPNVSEIMASCTLQMYNIFSLIDIAIEIEEVLGIKLHTHRVNYPTFLDARVIPIPLRNDLILKFKEYLELNVCSNNVKNHITDAINMLSSGNYLHTGKLLETELPKFVEFSDILDKKQSVKLSWRELLPELHKYVEDNNISKGSSI